MSQTIDIDAVIKSAEKKQREISAKLIVDILASISLIAFIVSMFGSNWKLSVIFLLFSTIFTISSQRFIIDAK